MPGNVVPDRSDNENFLDDVKAIFAGDKDYGPPPSSPPIPGGTGFAPTRGPLYSDFGP